MVTNYGEGGGVYKTGGGGGGKQSFTPTKRREKFKPCGRGGGTKCFWVVLAILKGWGMQKVSTLEKGGGGAGTETLTLLRGGAQKVSDPRFSHFVALPLINDQSLSFIASSIDLQSVIDLLKCQHQFFRDWLFIMGRWGLQNGKWRVRNFLYQRYSSSPYRLGKLACPRVNDDQKINMGDQKLNSGSPHDYWILESLFYKISFIFFYIFTALEKECT